MPEYSQIAGFMKWAAEISLVTGWKPNERPYKLDLANRLSTTRDRFIADDPQWFELLLADLSHWNLLNWRFRDYLKALGGDQLDACCGLRPCRYMTPRCCTHWFGGTPPAVGYARFRPSHYF